MKDYKIHEKNAIILMKIGGAMSMVASYLIMRDILIRHHKRERVKLTSRIVYELSLANFWASFFDPFMSTWMAPAETEVYLASGTTATCSFQGFCDNFFYGTSVFMNALLAVTYCILARYGREDKLRSKRSQWLVLGLPPLFVFFLSLGPHFHQAYNYTDGHVCSIGPHPMDCLDDGSKNECIRGAEAKKMKILRFSFVFTANVVIIISVVILIHSLVQREKRMTANNNTGNNNMHDDAAGRNQVRYSTRKTWQGIWYVAAFMTSWGPWYIWQFFRITADMQVDDTNSALLIYVLALTSPTQGVWNAMVYFRPFYLKYRERDGSEPRITAVCRVIGVPVPRCFNAEWRRSLLSHQETKEGSITPQG